MQRERRRFNDETMMHLNIDPCSDNGWPESYLSADMLPNQYIHYNNIDL